MFDVIRVSVHSCLRTAAGSLSHLPVLILGAGTALFLPSAAKQFLAVWGRLAHTSWALIATDTILAVGLMIGFRALHRAFRARRLATMANDAGLVEYFPHHPRAAEPRLAIVEEKHGAGRMVYAIGSSGAGTVPDRVGSLSTVLDQCLGARIMLANPFHPETAARIEAGLHPARDVAAFREEICASIALLKRLKAIGKDVRLKLYEDPPLIKMLLLGDYLWFQHYHAELHAQAMPEYVVRRHHTQPGLYTLYAHYFRQRWDDSRMPEYDLGTDELVYRNTGGHELRREPCGDLPSLGTPSDISVCLPHLGPVPELIHPH